MSGVVMGPDFSGRGQFRTLLAGKGSTLELL